MHNINPTNTETRVTIQRSVFLALYILFHYALPKHWKPFPAGIHIISLSTSFGSTFKVSTVNAIHYILSATIL